MSVFNAEEQQLYNRVLLTGAAGGLGQVLRERLPGFAKHVRLSDICEMAPAQPQEEVVTCDLADKAAVDALVAGCDAIVHFGGVSTEKSFETVLGANICGVFHLYEAARRHGVKRVVFASSNHVIGFYKQTERLDPTCQHRPDSYYGLSKAYGEDLATFYYDRYGIETVSIRIGSSFPEPQNRRMLDTWLSYNDLVHLVERSLYAKGVGHTVVYGVSANRDTWWDNRLAAHLGYHPKDTSEPWRAAIEALPPLADDDPLRVYQGGAFVAAGPFEG
ncbi:MULTISPECIES: NAD-dependent epimerase/dehydratase family protein [Pseudomonas]|uniref:NAD(P)-dependent oxidoreductase n=1 Tax=Pseudomonas quercus TaxID=2722792 RepID=A0ABX0YH14_9PSED|nr:MULTISPECIES: NAD(P)-dependent oxidoreductase [Pseudomonas]MBF7142926.1 NAD(P)-dependent oxidoreductase [Pseudomonas sp. LY10J]NJP01474.1 NAD(P)-dependent oxidoreductase [Pseudomonas quercus]